jgi:hypothetical protein
MAESEQPEVELTAVEPEAGAAAADGSRSSRALEFAKGGVGLLGTATVKVVSRTLAWGSLGFGVGLVAFFVMLGAGLLDHTWEHWSLVRWAFLLVYPLAGAGCLGYAGVWRGAGRTILHVGVERGWVAYVTEALFTRLVGYARKSERLDDAMSQAEVFLTELPVDTWEKNLKGAVNDYVSEDDLEGEVTGIRRRVLRWIKRILVGRIERYLLSIVRSEGGDGKISMDKVRKVALEHVEDTFADMILGIMKKQLIIMSLVFTAILVLPPVILHFV